MPIKDLHDEWTAELYEDLKGEWTSELCETIEGYWVRYLELFNDNFTEDHDISATDWGYLIYFLGFYNCSRFSCGNNDGSGIIEPELVPSLAWIRSILFPDEAPEPDF